MRKRKKRKENHLRKGMVFYIAIVLMSTIGTGAAFAASDPLSVIDNLSTFIFSLIRALGLILTGLGSCRWGFHSNHMIRVKEQMDFLPLREVS